MSASVRTVVFPAAGLGTRLLPATKAFPKELLPIVDRPIIQHGVEEAVQSGISRVVLVTSRQNDAASAHFAASPALERILAERGKTRELAAVRAVTALATVMTVHQTDPRGLGHAILAATDTVGADPFAVVLPDDLIQAEPPALRQMIDIFDALQGPVILVERVPWESVHRYGIVDASPLGNGVYAIHGLVEKPAPDRAPSNLAIVGRYILTPDLFPVLASTGQDAGGEIQLTDALRALLTRRPLYACTLDGAVRHDVGNPAGFIKASVHFALQHPDIGPALSAYLRTLDA